MPKKSRLEVTEVSRNKYRESCKKLATDNEKLHDTLFQSEKDTVDVITFMKKGELDKDDKIQELEQELRDLRKESRLEKEKLMAEFNTSAAELENKLHQRTNEVKLMQSELKIVKEFRRKRAQMQAELDEIKEGLYMANMEHKDIVQKMEHKFFEEKLRLEREASQKIAELAERAHTEAIANLEALDQVRSEIAMNRSQYVQAAKAAYQQKMMAAHAGQGSYPKIRTFQKSDTSTNSVFADLSEAENWSSLGTKVDIRELTWEQKEKVLRLLFAKMNGIAHKKKLSKGQQALLHPPTAKQLSIKDKPNPAPDQPTFLTESEDPVAVTTSQSAPGVTLPDIGRQTNVVVAN